MAKVLDLIYRVKDTASLPIRKIKAEQDDFTKSLKATREVYTASVAAITGVVVATGALIKNYQEYTITVGDTAKALGTTTQEASALLEMTGDLGIQIGDLEMAFRKMAQKGVDPSIEGLIQVRAILDQARDPAERLALAQEYLGRSGSSLLPMYDQLTNQQLRGFIDTMTEAQIVTEEEYQNALENRDAIDAWNDQIDSLKLNVGGFLTKGLLPWLKMGQAMPMVLERSALAIRQWAADIFHASEATKEAIRQDIAAFEERYNAKEQLQQVMIPAIEEYAQAIAEVPKSVNTVLSLSMGDVGGAAGAAGGNWGGLVAQFGTSSSGKQIGQIVIGSHGQRYRYTGNPAHPYEKIGGQAGLDLTVPPGFPGDSFPVFASSGERVQITPAGGGGPGSGPEVAALASEVRLLVRSLPVILRDAVAR